MKEALESCDGRGPRLRERGEVKEVMRRLMGRSVGLVCSLLQCLVVLGLPESFPLSGDHGAARDTWSVHLAQLPKLEKAGASMAPINTVILSPSYVPAKVFVFHSSPSHPPPPSTNLAQMSMFSMIASSCMRRAAELCTR
jgi:hypothetical protein